MKPYFSKIKKEINDRAKEATLGVLRINNPALRTHLDKIIGQREKLVRGPVFEQMFAWEADNSVTMDDLVEQDLFDENFIEALDDENNKDHRFGRDWHPYKHQLKAWQDLLADEPQSRVITSGTGSGKTETFMFPVIQDLIRQHEKSNEEQLEGVHALFLYPLNALINSQKERLSAWTKHFNGKIRYCLFNGSTPKFNSGNIKQKQEGNKQEVFSRQLLREKPAPILVTNGTMLEYMLIRQDDAPIIEKSKGKLRWIILDEAHSYVGSQAAELALQLRRVMEAFKVKAEDVRFIATSATIAGENVNNNLKKYLAELAGISESQVDVIDGKRIVPKLPKFELNTTVQEKSLKEIRDIDSDKEVSKERFNALCQSKVALKIRRLLTEDNNGAVASHEIITNLNADGLSFNEELLFQWLDVCTGTKPDDTGESFLKLRAHYFQRTLHGIWSCIDESCRLKDWDKNNEWPFGQVYSQQKPMCECGRPILEVVFCQDCKEPHLIGVEKEKTLQQWTEKIDDEFSLLNENEAEENNNEDKRRYPVTIASSDAEFAHKESDANDYVLEFLDRDNKLGNKNGKLSFHYWYNQETPAVCGYCGNKGTGGYGFYRRAILGAPFYITNLVQTVLEYCPDFKYTPLDRPSRGRRLITFTDSRQGTARLTLRMQQNAERSTLRGMVFNELVQKSTQVLDVPENLKPISETLIHLDNVNALNEVTINEVAENSSLSIKQLEPVVIAIRDKRYKSEFAPISWNDMVSKLVKNPIESWIFNNNKSLGVDSSKAMAEVLLLREFVRRPKKVNSLETQGLVQLPYPGINKINQVPEAWEKYSLTIQDWKDFLKIAVDFYIREKYFVNISWDKINWMGMKIYKKLLVSSTSNLNKNNDKEDKTKKSNWVQYSKGQPDRLVKLLLAATELDVSNREAKDTINGWLEQAWSDLIHYVLKETTEGEYYLDFESSELRLITEAFICPETNKLLDTTFKGFTPYLPRNYHKNPSKYLCEKIAMPAYGNFRSGGGAPEDKLDIIRGQVQSDSTVQLLRSKSLWTDINDRAVEGGNYYTVAEHSAQQSSEQLVAYEDEFKSGERNILNCSTTMEMGVDIGGISAVLMNNVPPHPANYLQRAGRAGRSQESRALSFTLCKHNPHDMMVYQNPKWPFETVINPPYVNYSSTKLINRHVNSYLFAYFLNNIIGITNTEKLSLNNSWFYEGGDESPANKLISFMAQDNIQNQQECENAIKILIKGTASENLSIAAIVESGKEKIKLLNDKWNNEVTYLKEEIESATKDSPYHFKLNKEIERLQKEYLLKELSQKGFLPGYGFPTDVVTFNYNNILDFKNRKTKKKDEDSERVDNTAWFRGLPSRNLNIAIREYAPGSDVVINGRVFRSAGIKLSGNQLYREGAKEFQAFSTAWRCHSCGEIGVAEYHSQQENLRCAACSNQIRVEDKRRYIEPDGFVVDFYIKPQAYVEDHVHIPFQSPWVIADGHWLSLPREDLGEMRSSSQGSVFFHSSGKNGHGYALCLSCGRSDSMINENEPPKSLSIEEPHKPVLPNKSDKDVDGKIKDCDGSSKIEMNVDIGSHSRTDVFELLIKNNKNEYIVPKSENDIDTGKIIATTLAVALRRAATEALGVLSNELLYAVRQLNKSGSVIYALQLFDSVSGGAGFATSVKHEINRVLSKTFEILNNCDCEKYCASCLLETDSRHDINKLDRKAALKWLGSDYEKRVNPNFNWTQIENPVYTAYSLREKLDELCRRKPQSVTFVWSKEVNDWDVSLVEIRRKIHQLMGKDIDVSIVVPKLEYSDEIKLFLIDIENLGVSLKTANQIDSKAVFQIIEKQKVTTVANKDATLCCIPGEIWLDSSSTSVFSTTEAEWNTEILDTSDWTGTLFEQKGNRLIQINTQLNGRLRTFGDKLKNLLTTEYSETEQLLKEDVLSMEYSDRYLRSPESALLLANLLTIFKYNDDSTIYIKTSSEAENKQNYHQFNNPKYISHNWPNKESIEKNISLILNKYLPKSLNKDVKVIDKFSLSHYRLMTIKFVNGQKLKIFFDQGMGYWNIQCDPANKRFHDFEQSPEQQCETLKTNMNNYYVNQFRNKEILDTVLWLAWEIE